MCFQKHMLSIKTLFKKSMGGYTSCLLVGVVAGLTMVVSPCQAQTTVDNTDNVSIGNNEMLKAPQSDIDVSDNNNSANKSVAPSNEVSQASSVTTAKVNPRIPIFSRIFPTMQQ